MKKATIKKLLKSFVTIDDKSMNKIKNLDMTVTSTTLTNRQLVGNVITTPSTSIGTLNVGAGLSPCSGQNLPTGNAGQVITVNGINTGSWSPAQGTMILGNTASRYHNNGMSDGRSAMMSTKYGNLTRFQIDMLELLAEDKPDAIVVISENSVDLNNRNMSVGYVPVTNVAKENYALKKQLINTGIDPIEVFSRQFTKQKIEQVPTQVTIAGNNTGNQNINNVGVSPGNFASITVAANGAITSHNPPTNPAVGTTWFDPVTCQMYIQTPQGAMAMHGYSPPPPTPAPQPQYATMSLNITKNYAYDIIVIENDNDLTLMSIVGFIKLEESLKLSEFVKDLKDSISSGY